MFRSFARCTVAVAFVLALILFTVPAHAQPGDFGSRFTSDASWLDVALAWLDGLLGGGDAGTLQTLETGSKTGTGSTGGIGDASAMGGSCLDPWGGGGGGCDW